MRHFPFPPAISPIRRAAIGPSGPAMPGGGMICLLEASNIAAANDDPVAAWPDVGPLGLSFVSPSTDQQPAFKTNAINGKPAVYFEYNGTPKQVAASHDPGGITAAELIAVVRAVNGSPTFNNAGGFLNCSNDAQTQHYPFIDGIVYDSFGRVDRTSFTPTTSLADWHTFNVRSDTATKTTRINGTLQATVGAGATQFLGSVRVGWSASTINFNGWVAMVAIYTRILSTDERAQAAAYVSTTYGLTL